LGLWTRPRNIGDAGRQTVIEKYAARTPATSRPRIRGVLEDLGDPTVHRTGTGVDRHEMSVLKSASGIDADAKRVSSDWIQSGLHILLAAPHFGPAVVS